VEVYLTRESIRYNSSSSCASLLHSDHSGPHEGECQPILDPSYAPLNIVRPPFSPLSADQDLLSSHTLHRREFVNHRRCHLQRNVADVRTGRVSGVERDTNVL
jgi:hypothetical protein